MASSLHQQLKHHYVADTDQHEVDVDGYRIDAIDSRDRLIEIQCASLSAIRGKIKALLQSHEVIVVKPLALRKRIVKQESVDGRIISSRFSPSKQTLAWIFQDLVHFSSVFPHPGLRLDILLTDQEEIRIPPGPRSSWKKKYAVADRRLVGIQNHYQLQTPTDLWTALEITLPKQFSTSDLATASGMPRWLCQKAAYCFRQMDFFRVTSKQGNAIVYELAKPLRSKRRPKAVG